MKILLFLISSFCLFNFVSAQSKFIHVDQFGYLPDAAKVAVLSNPVNGFNGSENYNPPANLEVRNALTNAIVFTGASTMWNNGATHSDSGDRGWWFDFTSLTINGDYYVFDPINNEKSPVFSIKNDVYASVIKDAGRMYFYNRCNYEKAAPYAETGWTDGMNFKNSGQDTDCRYYLTPNDASSARDLSGGWFDAGDYNKYTTFAEGPIHDLLWAYRDYPQAFSDDWNLPESGNGIPDIIDEIKWEIDWLKKMDNSDGSVIIKMGSVSHGVNNSAPPSANTDARYYGKTCTSASIAFAGMLAHAAVVYRDFPALAGEVNQLAADAERAFDYFIGKLNNNDLETDCDDGTIVAGIADRDVNDQMHSALTAAIHLFELTGKAKFNNYIVDRIEIGANPTEATPLNYWWGPYTMPLNSALLHYTTLPNRDVALTNFIIDRLANPVNSNNDEFYGFTDTDLYRAYVPDWSYHWGSNLPKAHFGNMNLLAEKYNLKPAARASLQLKASEQLHYFHGVNPLGIVYLTNMNDRGAERSVDEIYHAWFQDNSQWDNVQNSTGPAPGYMPGGPNKNYNASQISPPANQPAMKSYLSFNTGWPESSWEITEPAIYSQAGYIRLLASQVPESTVLAVTYDQPLTAQVQDNQIVVNWKIAEEINADFYEIQHQTLNGKWKAIGKVAATKSNKYNYLHSNPAQGENFYRLRQVDRDGRFSYSNIASVSYLDKYADIIIVNPIINNQLTINNLPERVTVRISNIKGKVITILKSGGGSLNYEMGSLPQGIYVVEILTVGQRLIKTERVVK